MRMLLLLLVMATGLLPAGAGAQDGAASADGRDADRAAIRAHIESIFQAYIDKDRQTILATHTHDWHGFSMGAHRHVRNLDEYMQGADQSLKNWPIVAYEISDFDVVFYGDVATAYFLADYTLNRGGDPETYTMRVLDVYIMEDGHWNQAGSHLSQHPRDTARAMQQMARVTPTMRERILAEREAVWRAWFTNDREKLEQVIPEEAIAMSEDDTDWLNRDGILAGAEAFAGSGATLVRLEFPRTEIQVYGNTVLLYTTYLYETDQNGQRATTTGQGIETFVVRDNHFVNTGWLLTTMGQ